MTAMLDGERLAITQSLHLVGSTETRQVIATQEGRGARQCPNRLAPGLDRLRGHRLPWLWWNWWMCRWVQSREALLMGRY